MFAIHPFPFLSQCMRGHFCEIWAYAMRDVVNCDMIYDIFLGDKLNVDYHSKAWIWNGSDPNHIVTVHESRALTFVFVIRRWCCWFATHYLPKPECRMGVWFWWHIKMRAKDGEGLWLLKAYDEGTMLRSLCCSWNPTFSSVKTFFLDRLVPIFTSHVLDTIGQSNTYFFLLPFTQCLMSSGKNQDSYSTLLGERNSFLSLLYIGIGVPCLLVPTLTLHIVPIMACSVQHRLAILQCVTWKQDNQSLTRM